VARGEVTLAIGVWLLAACSGSDQVRTSDAREDDRVDPRAAEVGSAPDSGLLRQTERLVAFLRETGPLAEGLLADSVTLLLAPEGGGATRVASAAELRDRPSWQVGGRSLLPPSALPQLTLYPGSHVNCRALPLAELYPELARRPHVGALLTAAAGESCLQTWNATFVFDRSATMARLTAVVYDQWEW
jgi:hypothetical protein